MNANLSTKIPGLRTKSSAKCLRSLPREPAQPRLHRRGDVPAGGPREAGRRATAPRGGGLPGPRRLPAWSGWLMAAAALLLCGLGLREWQHQREVDESLRRIAELRGQYQELASQIAELKEEAAGGSRPVVYLGGNHEVDLVLDLDRLAAAQKNPQPPDPAERQKAKEELTRLYQEGGNTPLY